MFGRAYMTNDVNVLHHLLPRQRSLSFRKKALIKGAEKEATLPSTQYPWICKVVILCYKLYFQNYQLVSFDANGQTALTGLQTTVHTMMASIVGRSEGWHFAFIFREASQKV